MLVRLYHPLLFRDLAVANAAVRNNALQLMIDAFPLQDSGAPAEVGPHFGNNAMSAVSKIMCGGAVPLPALQGPGCCSCCCAQQRPAAHD